MPAVVLVGFDILVELNPVIGLQAYVLPATEATPSDTLVTVHVSSWSVPAFAVGTVVLLVTTTTSVAVQPVAVVVTVNV